MRNNTRNILLLFAMLTSLSCSLLRLTGAVFFGHDIKNKPGNTVNRNI